MYKVKVLLGPLYPIVSAAIVFIALFTVSRLGLSLWQIERVNDAQGWGNIFLGGLRVDVSSVCYLLILPALLSALFSGDHLLGRCWHVILRLWLTAGLWLVVYMEVATVPFIQEYDLRPNRLFVEYLIYPKEVFGMLWSGYKLELLIGLVTSVVTIFIGWRWSKNLVTGLSFPRWYWRPVIAVGVVALGVMGARSSFEHRPMNPAMVAFSSDPLMNDFALNSSYSVIFAAKQMGAEASAFQFYPKMAKEKIIAEVKASMNVDPQDFVPGDKPTLARHQAQYQGKPKNIVILLLESHGAQFVSHLGGINASPNIDRLIDEGWAFTRMYATGTRSVRGIEAVTTGFTPTPARAVVKLGKSQTNFFTIADLLKTQGYHTQFIYGGESHFDNMKSFFLGNGFVDIQDFPTFQAPEFVGSWGASDTDLYKKADEQFTRLDAQGEPFFSLVFSSSNHTPYEFPDSPFELYNQPKNTQENAVKYADYALGQFVKQAKQSAYWNDTIFVVVADHDARTSGNLPVPIGHFKIPAIIFGGGIEHRLDDRLASQIDLPPTLLSLAGISSVNPMVGNDMTKTVPVDKQRALMQRDKNFGWMTADNQVVVIRPEQGITTYRYDPQHDTLTDHPVAEPIVDRAHAYAMWGSLAFQNNYYQAQENYHSPQVE
ncbi:Lipoteichoic acid synthase 1 [Vibrio ruber DSM 16370]|uniref:Lipoteichoic acid synthase 1 n=1 Tax=Vibrio ruber (strain DSM 16370 / JCM 11486 / BCRC 17186 / CECT 7878 / LMG 23124 / VR1) TaxID=1123498 RepID=A0A1R4LTB7_VIBR1|nr:LTA synthase family protein [Vibrio ruber]SJN59841.1 Lipoteichoic acid synthase 1 [Vibrio ruber DSM 16370]